MAVRGVVRPTRLPVCRPGPDLPPGRRRPGRSGLEQPGEAPAEHHRGEESGDHRAPPPEGRHRIRFGPDGDPAGATGPARPRAPGPVPRPSPTNPPSHASPWNRPGPPEAPALSPDDYPWRRVPGGPPAVPRPRRTFPATRNGGAGPRHGSFQRWGRSPDRVEDVAIPPPRTAGTAGHPPAARPAVRRRATGRRRAPARAQRGRSRAVAYRRTANRMMWSRNGRWSRGSGWAMSVSRTIATPGAA